MKTDVKVLTGDELIRTIVLNDANIDYIRHTPDRKINGGLLFEIRRVMQAYALQEVKLHLEIAAEKAKFGKNFVIDKSSITGIEIKLS